MPASPQLIADRFLVTAGATIDVGTGGAVQLEIAPPAAGGGAAWADRCAAAARLRHPAARPLLDYGVLDAGRAFLAFGGEHPTGRRPDAAVVRHARRFAAAQDATPLLRLRRRVPLAASRPVGTVLQPRRALAVLVEAFAASAPAGVACLEVRGPSGSGLSTLLVLAARELRLRGFLPVRADLVAAHPEWAPLFARRHLAVIVPPGSPAAAAPAALLALARAGDTARRHLLVRFTRGGSAPHGDAIMMDAMTPAALAAMIARDRWAGPIGHDVALAARHAGGLPGAMLRALGGADVSPTIVAVRETSPAYVVAPAAASAAGRVTRMLWDAAAQGQRLAAAGRHAAAIRLLERAARVLLARGEHGPAAAAMLTLGWILRSRGRGREARACFERLLAGPRSPRSLAAAVAIGVIDTDDLRFAAAEAALRSAVTAASVLGDGDLEADARLALARCLLHQGRSGDGLAVLEPATAPGRSVPVQALTARLHASAGAVPAALAAAGTAVGRLTARDEPRLQAASLRALAECRLSGNDGTGAVEAAERALRAARSAHLPLAALKCRTMLIRARRALSGEAGGRLPVLPRAQRASLPPLLVREVERLEREPAPPPPAPMAALRRCLDRVQSAGDDLAAVRAVCELVAAELGAADVAVLEGPDAQVLVRTGRPLAGSGCGVRAISSGTTVMSPAQPVECAAPVVYGGAVLGALECRLAAGREVHRAAVAALLEAAAVSLEAPLRAVADRRHAPTPDERWPELLGASPPALALRQAILAAARAPFPVLVEGESGSGKELVARAIHRLGPRAARRICTLNCAALSDDLLEAELFGHTRGAFTGAIGERTGLFEDADGGTLFLDEVGELSPRAQAKLLRALQDGEVRRIGESFARRVNTRVVAATNRELTEEVAAGRFRADLRFRLDVIRITVPPLRERASDIPLLAAHFWQDATARLGSRATLSADTLAALARCDWPGNVRELQNVVFALAVHGPRRGRITPSLLPSSIARTAGTAPRRFDEAREEFERRFVRAALAAAGGHRARAARSLGVSRQGLAKMLRRLRLDGAESGMAGAGG